MTARRRIAVVTTSRAEYGLLRHVLRALIADSRAEAGLIVSGSHLSARHGHTVREIEAEGAPIWSRVPLDQSSDEPLEIARVTGRAVSGFAEQFDRIAPDIVLVLGDRSEVLAASIAAVLTGRILAHLNGGEVTGGSLDEGWRHAITKIAHLHLPATREFATRIRRMGEDAWRIRVVGSPGVEAIRLTERLSASELEAILGRKLAAPVVVCTYHPVTNAPAATDRESDALLTALERSGVGTVIFTAPNADAGGDRVRERIEEATRRDPRFVLVPSLGSTAYLSALALADALAGNSSSGLIEAPSLRLPTVNVGSRQDGRPRAANVIDAPGDPAKIGRALAKALSPRFRAGLRGLRNPYGDGRTSERVSDFLLGVELDARLHAKRFADR